MTASTTTPPSRISLLSRLKGPFASKQHPQVRQEIELDKPYSEFAPGDSITGRVILDAPKPIRATHLVARLHGFVKVITHSRLPGEAIPYDENLLNSSKGRRGGEYFGNGFAKLFEDEQVLCGDGRLCGKYSFQFELLLPEKGIPSSIDFENGTITYLLSSTLTRPTTISPVMIEYCKLKIKETIDIAPIPRPRPQSVSLETVQNRRPVMYMKRRTSGSTNGKEQVNPPGEGRESQVTSPSATNETPASPVASAGSSNSVKSDSTSDLRHRSCPPTAQEARSATSGVFSQASSDKTITAQTEVLQGGCLPGDSLQVKVSVDHTKAIKSMQGVIATFYRLSRIDTHPALPLGPADQRSKARYEDYYPKSRTGLGGLSLSSSGSSRTFRQDLAQSIAPLIVDPKTLTAISRTSIQVPDHIFPSIGGVPGTMISFKYFVEIVIDLRGKMGQDRIRPRFSMTHTAQHAYEDPKVNVVNAADGYTFLTTPGFNFLITDQIRRQKGVVFTKTEIILGTRDSTRARGKQKADDTNGIDQNIPSPRLSDPPSFSALVNGNHITESPNRHLDSRFTPPLQQPLLTPPSAPPEEELDEKSRIRRAETTLLPSAPPDSSSSSNGQEPVPSAPLVFGEDDLLHRYMYPQPAPRYEAPAVAVAAAPQGVQDPINHGNNVHHGQSNRTPNESPITSNEDKQELERKRLQVLASSPYDSGIEDSVNERNSTIDASLQASTEPATTSHGNNSNNQQALEQPSLADAEQSSKSGRSSQSEPDREQGDEPTQDVGKADSSSVSEEPGQREADNSPDSCTNVDRVSAGNNEHLPAYMR